MRHDNRITLALAACLTAAAGLVAMPNPAAACGGLFCNSSNPVNQAAERILFVDNGDGTTTAVIQIMYEGPADEFAWVLPLGDIADPDNDIKVSSDLALQRLQQSTNPQYNLNVTVEGSCKDDCSGCGGVATGTSAPGAFANDSAESGDGGGVVVEASGSVGPFDFELISVDDAAGDKAQVAIDWLDTNGYDLGIGDEVLRPYLEMDQKLLCVRLSSGNDAGSVRPLMVTYEGDNPAIPIRPTAVAANDDMGILVFVGGEERAIPKNYAMLELNDALIDWFNPNQSYNNVVIEAANEAQGHGFVTEYADGSDTLDQVIVQDWERDQWNSFQGQSFTADQTMVQESFQWSGWDGFRDAFAAASMLPNTVSVDDIINCPSCYLDGAKESYGITFDRDAFRTALYEFVLRPMFDTDSLLLSAQYITRLYTTMSADEMTDDPVFDFNPDLQSVSNINTAEQIIMCNPTVDRFEAPYRIELPSGSTVFGDDQGVWPVDIDEPELPFARRIAMAGTSGEPVVMVDNVEAIDQALSENAPDGYTGPGMDPVGDDESDGSGGDSAGLCSVGSVGAAAPKLPGILLMALAIGLVRRRRR